MRYKLCLSLEKEYIDLDYRKSILSFIKKSLQEYSKEYYEKLYHAKDPIMKEFTFAVFLNHPKFTKEKVIIEDKKIEINLSIVDMELAMILYNAFNRQRNKIFHLNQNSWKLENIYMLAEKEIKNETMLIQTMSPIVARGRENKKDFYYSFGHSEFEKILKINIKSQLKISKLPEELVETFQIKAIEPKKVVLQFYEKQLEGSTGIYQICGDKRLLKYLYQAGIRLKA